ncbi:MAG: dihydropteroate synthase [Verrucomicrobiia bacterium]
MRLRAGKFAYDFPRATIVMGIINVTPDSFYNGGRYFDHNRAVERAFELIEEGAEILDIGGESTRPGAQPVEEKEELKRVIPVIERIADKINIPISIDTVKPEVARRALAAGASLINDIAANRQEPEMWQIVAETGAGYIVNHMKGSPQTMQLNPVYCDVVKEIDDFFEDRLRRLKSIGVYEDQVVLDPGIGFGKTVEHNLKILKNVKYFGKWGRPVMIGASRKSFIGKILNLDVEFRLSGSLACAAWAVMNGVKIIRAHDVRETVQVAKMIEAIMTEGDAGNDD